MSLRHDFKTVGTAERSTGCAEAMRLLHLSGEMWWDYSYPEVCESDYVKPGQGDIAHAITVLPLSANYVASGLQQRSIETLKKFDRVKRKLVPSLELKTDEPTVKKKNVAGLETHVSMPYCEFQWR